MSFVFLLNSCTKDSDLSPLDDQEVDLRMSPEEQQFVDDINLKTHNLDQMLRGNTNDSYAIEDTLEKQPHISRDLSNLWPTCLL